MYAIIEDGGRQFKVQEGEELDIDYRDVASGEQVTFDRILAVRTTDESIVIGQPMVPSATVTAEVVGTTQGEKLYIQKFRRRKTLRKRTGHRQIYTRVKISKIAVG